MAPVRTIEQYKEWMQFHPYGANHTVTTRGEHPDRLEEHRKAMKRLAKNWHKPGTPLHQLHTPGYIFKLDADNSKHPPTLHDMRTNRAQTTARFAGLFQRIMNGQHFDRRWRRAMTLRPRLGEDINRDFVLDPRGQGLGNVPEGAPSVCLPIDTERVNGVPAAAAAAAAANGLPPPRPSGPHNQRTHLSKHKGGYVRVYCGTDIEGRGVQVSLHTLVCMAYHGQPEMLKEARGNKAAVYQQVSHICGNPWCVNPRHLEWADTGHNGKWGATPDKAYLEQRHTDPAQPGNIYQKPNDGMFWRLNDGF